VGWAHSACYRICSVRLEAGFLEWNHSSVASLLRMREEIFMADNKNPNEKQQGEKPEGKYHYNPGNQSGKTIGTNKPKPERQNNLDRMNDRRGEGEQNCD
jgi:hypothetical protein